MFGGGWLACKHFKGSTLPMFTTALEGTRTTVPKVYYLQVHWSLSSILAPRRRRTKRALRQHAAPQRACALNRGRHRGAPARTPGGAAIERETKEAGLTAAQFCARALSRFSVLFLLDVPRTHLAASGRGRGTTTAIDCPTWSSVDATGNRAVTTRTARHAQPVAATRRRRASIRSHALSRYGVGGAG